MAGWRQAQAAPSKPLRAQAERGPPPPPQRALRMRTQPMPRAVCESMPPVPSATWSPGMPPQPQRQRHWVWRRLPNRAEATWFPLSRPRDPPQRQRWGRSGRMGSPMPLCRTATTPGQQWVKTPDAAPTTPQTPPPPAHWPPRPSRRTFAVNGLACRSGATATPRQTPAKVSLDEAMTRVAPRPHRTNTAACHLPLSKPLREQRPGSAHPTPRFRCATLAEAPAALPEIRS